MRRCMLWTIAVSLVCDLGTSRNVCLAQGTVTVSTLAGIGGSSGFVDGQGPGARFQGPGDIVVDALGNVDVSDINTSGGYSVRKITPGGLVTTTSINGYHLAVSSFGDLYVSSGSGIEKYTASGQRIAVKTGAVPLGGPIAVDRAGNLFIGGGSTLYKLAPDGSSTSRPGFVSMDSIVIDSNGVIYIAGNGAVWISNSDGSLQQLAGAAGNRGSTDGVGANARFGTRLSLAIDAEGNLYATDSDNATIRKISLVPFGDQFRPESVSTIAGLAGSTGSQDGSGSNARFFNPTGIAVDQVSGAVYVSDSANRTIRKITGAANPASVNPPPTLLAVTPNSIAQGSSDTAVTLTGSNFIQSSVAQIGTTPVATSFVNFTTLSAVIPSTNMGSAGILDITVSNPSPGGGISNSVQMSVVASAQQPNTTPLPIPEVENGMAQSGYVILTPDSDTSTPTAFVSYGSVQNGIVQSKAGILPISLTTSASVSVEIVRTINRNLGVAIANPSAQTNTVTLTLRDENGTVVGAPITLAIAPYSQLAQFVGELFPADLTGPSFIGSINLQSAVPFAPLGLAFTGATFSVTAPATAPTTSVMPIRSLSVGAVADTPTAGIVGGAGSVIFPQFAFGGGWATQIALINTGTTTATGRIDLFDSNGRPVAVKLNGVAKSTFIYSIPAGGVLILAPRDQNGQSPL